jgi:antiviral helicase SKI2
MTIVPTRNLITGEIVGYEDAPISTDSLGHELNRPISDCEQYHVGVSNVPFLPSGMYIPKLSEKVDLSDFIPPIETGSNLLTSPNSRSSEKAERLEPLPDLPAIEATKVPNPWDDTERRPDEVTAVIDDWDVSQFEAELPQLAYDFKFPLDPFQMRAIRHLERNETVFVSAPTSAGKTVIAQYAIALCRSHKMRDRKSTRLNSSHS